MKSTKSILKTVVFFAMCTCLIIGAFWGVTQLNKAMTNDNKATEHSVASAHALNDFSGAFPEWFDDDTYNRDACISVIDDVNSVHCVDFVQRKIVINSNPGTGGEVFIYSNVTGTVVGVLNNAEHRVGNLYYRIDNLFEMYGADVMSSLDIFYICTTSFMPCPVCGSYSASHSMYYAARFGAESPISESDGALPHWVSVDDFANINQGIENISLIEQVKFSDNVNFDYPTSTLKVAYAAKPAVFHYNYYAYAYDIATGQVTQCKQFGYSDGFLSVYIAPVGNLNAVSFFVCTGVLNEDLTMTVRGFVVDCFTETRQAAPDWIDSGYVDNLFAGRITVNFDTEAKQASILSKADYLANGTKTEIRIFSTFTKQEVFRAQFIDDVCDLSALFELTVAEYKDFYAIVDVQIPYQRLGTLFEFSVPVTDPSFKWEEQAVTCDVDKAAKTLAFSCDETIGFYSLRSYYYLADGSVVTVELGDVLTPYTGPIDISGYAKLFDADVTGRRGVNLYLYDVYGRWRVYNAGFEYEPDEYYAVTYGYDNDGVLWFDRNPNVLMYDVTGLRNLTSGHIYEGIVSEPCSMGIGLGLDLFRYLGLDYGEHEATVKLTYRNGKERNIKVNLGSLSNVNAWDNGVKLDFQATDFNLSAYTWTGLRDMNGTSYDLGQQLEIFDEDVFYYQLLLENYVDSGEYVLTFLFRTDRNTTFQKEFTVNYESAKLKAEDIEFLYYENTIEVMHEVKYPALVYYLMTIKGVNTGATYLDYRHYAGKPEYMCKLDEDIDLTKYFSFLNKDTEFEIVLRFVRDERVLDVPFVFKYAGYSPDKITVTSSGTQISITADFPIYRFFVVYVGNVKTGEGGIPKYAATAINGRIVSVRKFSDLIPDDGYYEFTFMVVTDNNFEVPKKATLYVEAGTEFSDAVEDIFDGIGEFFKGAGRSIKDFFVGLFGGDNLLATLWKWVKVVLIVIAVIIGIRILFFILKQLRKIKNSTNNKSEKNSTKKKASKKKKRGGKKK